MPPTIASVSSAEAKAWYKLAVARDPADSGTQVALYQLDTAASRTDEGLPGERVHVRPGIEDSSCSPSS